MGNELEQLRRKNEELEGRCRRLEQSLQESEEKFQRTFHSSSHLDITERNQAEISLRESEERFRLIAETVDEIFWMYDVEKEVATYLNPAFDRIWGFPKERTINDPDYFLNSIHPEDRKQVDSASEAIRAGKPYDYEYRIIRPDGTIRHLWSRIYPVPDSSGRPKRYVGVGQDVTEYKNLENQFLQAQKMEAIGILAGGVAHDFNNLLNVINGYSELLMDDLDHDNPMREDIEQINQAGQRAATLTSQLLAFSRKQILQAETLDLNTVISQMSTMLRRLIREDIEFVFVPNPDIKTVHADPVQIQQIVMNLTINARDAMPTGGKLTIETANVEFDEDYIRKHPMAKAGRYVMLAISDNGIGMGEDTKSRLFEPFYTTKERGKGTGLGLATVYGVVKQSNGFIWVYSEPGKGTTFKIYFPQEESGTVRTEAADKPESSYRGTETILIVEDETAVRALTSRILQDRGYKVLEAAEGNKALRIAGEYSGEIHMVVTDVIMPGLGGAKLVSSLEAERPGLKALYISGYTDNAIVHHGILDSHIAFLQKPFTVESLAKKVRNVLDS